MKSLRTGSSGENYQQLDKRKSTQQRAYHRGADKRAIEETIR